MHLRLLRSDTSCKKGDALLKAFGRRFGGGEQKKKTKQFGNATEEHGEGSIMISSCFSVNITEALQVIKGKRDGVMYREKLEKN